MERLIHMVDGMFVGILVIWVSETIVKWRNRA